jgi:hypothetical protein
MMGMTHEELCERARRWLGGTRRCNPVFSNCASCAEVPDAIGWSSGDGSTVIECKISVSDFYADKKKRIAWKHKEHGWIVRHIWKDQNEEFEQVEWPLMGDYRFYLCEPEIITSEQVETNAPDHGLVYKIGRQMRIVRPAPLRKNVDKDGEIRFLRFAIINRKLSFEEGTKEYALL